MGSDGTVGANKEAIKIIGAADKDIYVQVKHIQGKRLEYCCRIVCILAQFVQVHLWTL